MLPNKGWQLVTGSVTKVLARRSCTWFSLGPITEQSTRTPYNPLCTSNSSTPVRQVFGQKVVDANPPSNAAIASPRTKVTKRCWTVCNFRRAVVLPKKYRFAVPTLYEASKKSSTPRPQRAASRRKYKRRQPRRFLYCQTIAAVFSIMVLEGVCRSSSKVIFVRRPAIH